MSWKRKNSLYPAFDLRILIIYCDIEKKTKDL